MLQFGEGIADDPRTFLADALTEAYELLGDWPAYLSIAFVLFACFVRKRGDRLAPPTI